MKENKNIDRLFQEKFKDFEQTPREELWKNIAEKLQEKQEKKPVILPIWYKLGGVAAVLAIILTTVYFLQNSPANFTEPQITFDIEESQLPTFEMPTDSPLNHANKTLKEITETSSNSNIEEAKERESHSNNLGAMASQNTTQTLGIDTTSKNSNSEKTNSNSSNIASNKSNNEQELAHLDHKNGDETIQNQQTGNKVISSAENKNPNKTASQVASADSIKTKADEEYKTALAILSEEKNNATPEEVKIASKAGKVSISPFAAPVYYDNLGSGNPIDPSFAGNQTNSDVTMSYGIKVAYAISEKIKIRSGISKVSMNYKTQDIAYNYAIASSKISNINYEQGSENIRIASTVSRPDNYAETPHDFAPSSSLNLPRETGSLNQNFGYIEVPVEIEYSLIDKKFGLKLIGGASSLFLDENTVSVNGQSGSIELGESNNLESLSFTTNIGMGVDYQLNDKFKLNLEPTFKYQLNSFSNTSGVNPYFFGIYTGFSFEF
ncbi:PorT family protein [Zunongwangia pacifica]|uniref:PorT family protein n=1 Tax=Zunongwangia pacifica TaxID=2911062 RepID=A0A9X1ZNA9_9FLAO|nr:PorT family protein [Zunongwangia pacifica]MCL6217146.1 PorT family protein [Zunongwangia pacifica]